MEELGDEDVCLQEGLALVSLDFPQHVDEPFVVFVGGTDPEEVDLLTFDVVVAS